MSLTNTNVGDKLLILGTWKNRIGIVTRVTKTQVHCDQDKFRRNGRSMDGDRWSRDHAKPATEKDIAEVEEATLRNELICKIERNCVRKNLQNQTTSKFQAILKQCTNQQPDKPQA